MIDPNDKWLVARKGAVMTCINGHPIATLNSDLHWGDIYADKFSYIQPDPTGTTPVNCTVCGVQWFGYPAPKAERVRWIEEDGTSHE